MSQNRAARTTVMLTALGLTLLAVWYAAGLPTEGDAQEQAAQDLLPAPRERAPGSVGSTGPVTANVTLAVRPDGPAMPPQPAAADPAPSLALRSPSEAQATNLFAVRSWQPPAPPPAAQPPAPPPKAPPLPFTYIGRMTVDGQPVVFVNQGTDALTLRQGDVLPGYRVEAISARALTFVYLPLNQRQQLNLESAL